MRGQGQKDNIPSREELNRLQLVQLRTGGAGTLWARYDVDAKKVYILDSGGNVQRVWEGELKNLQKHENASEKETPEQIRPDSAVESTPEPELAADPEDQVPGDDDPEGDSSGEPAAEAKEGITAKKKVIIIVCALIVVGVMYCVLSAMSIYREQVTPEDTAAPPMTTEMEPTTEPTIATEEVTTSLPDTQQPFLSSVSVLRSKGAFLPGHVISKKDFETVEISGAEYQMVLSSGGIYTGEDLSSLKGYVVTSYIPEGSFLSYTDVGVSYAPENPWKDTGEYECVITLPVSAAPKTFADCLWGNIVDLELQITTQLSPSDESGAQNTETSPAGITHQSSRIESAITDTYTIQQITIVDVLDQNQKSLYIRYQSLASIPVVYRDKQLREIYTDEKLNGEIPCYIQVAVTGDQAAALEPLSGDNVTVTVTKRSQDTGTQMKASAYQSSREIGEILAEILHDLE